MSILIATFRDTKDIAKKVAKSLKAEYSEIFVEDFPDSEFHIKLRNNPRNKTVVIINSMAGNPNEKVIETVLAAGIAKDYGAKKIVLVATYLPYMRQDKHFEKYDSFSSKHVMELFKNFDKIFVLDPHLHRIKKMNLLSNKAERITTNELIAEYIRRKFKDNFEIVGPDSESNQWSSEIAKMLGKKVVIFNKIRFSAEKIKQKEKRMDKNIIIIDDIISTGKTLEGILKMAKKQGAEKLVCIGIHGVLAEKADKRITKYAKLITTNTIPNRYAEIDVSEAIIERLKNLK